MTIFPRPLGVAAALLATAGMLVAARAQTAGVAGGFRSSALTAVQRLMGALGQVGNTSCAPVFQQAAQFLFEDAPVQFVVQPLGPNANRWPTVVTAEGTHAAPPGSAAATQTRLTTLIVAPAGTCSGLYQQVIYWPEPCPALKKRVFAAFRNERLLQSRVRQSEANPGLQLYLMPAGAAGCVSVKKELIG